MSMAIMIGVIIAIGCALFYILCVEEKPDSPGLWSKIRSKSKKIMRKQTFRSPTGWKTVSGQPLFSIRKWIWVIVWLGMTTVSCLTFPSYVRKSLDAIFPPTAHASPIAADSVPASGTGGTALPETTLPTDPPQSPSGQTDTTNAANPNAGILGNITDLTSAMNTQDSRLGLIFEGLVNYLGIINQFNGNSLPAGINLPSPEEIASGTAPPLNEILSQADLPIQLAPSAMGLLGGIGNARSLQDLIMKPVRWLCLFTLLASYLALIPAVIATRKERGIPFRWWAFGSLCLPVTLLVAWRISPKRKVCPMCAELVQRGAVVCRYCGHRFD